MENLLGPQDGGKAIQQNNGLLCPTLLSLSQDFQLLPLVPSIHIHIVLHLKTKPNCYWLICIFGLFFLNMCLGRR